MKKLILALTLAALAPISWANKNLNSSRSNIYRVVSDASPAQVAALLNELNKTGLSDEARLTAWVRANAGRFGVQARKVVVLPKQGASGQISVIILADPGNESQARIAVSDSGTVSRPTPAPPKK